MEFKITKRDLFWNYGATFLRIASFALLLPFVLRMMSAEMVGIWNVFMTVSALSIMMDFGFSSSFIRNVTYVFSGVQNLQQKGFEIKASNTREINYSLLKGLIASMRWFYSRVSLLVFVLLITLGTYYISVLVKDYSGSAKHVYVAWFLFCLTTTYELYSLYYNSLLVGKGLVKLNKQIIILGQIIYIGFSALLLLLECGLLAIVVGQAVSVILIRYLSYRAFFTTEMKALLNNLEAYSKKKIIKLLFPNSIKIGLASIASFIKTKGTLIIGSLYLSLEDIASYGVTMQIISVAAGLSSIYTLTYQPKIVQFRTDRNFLNIKDLYLKGQIVLMATYLICSIGLYIVGDEVMTLIGSKTSLLPFHLILLGLISSIIEMNISLAGVILLTKNEVPFFKSTLLSAALTVFGFYFFFEFLKAGIYSLYLAPIIVNLLYQAWKWPLEVKKDLDFKLADISLLLSRRKSSKDKGRIVLKS